MQWWRSTLIPELGRQSKVYLWEFEISLVYRVNSRIARTISQRNPLLKEKVGIMICVCNPAHRRQRQADIHMFRVNSGLHNKFQDSQG